MADKKHSILSASSCERWWNCPGSVAACKDIPNPANKYTAEGTVAHAIAEESLRDPYKSLEEYIGTTRIQDGFEIEITEEMIDAVIEYKSYVLRIWNDAGRPPMVFEGKIELTEVNAVLWGSADCYFAVPYGIVHVFDFKYGEGKRVSAWENKQLLYYALGVMLKEDCGMATIHICQPRVEDGFSSYDQTNEQMQQFHKDLAVHAQQALDPKAPLCPGDWCKATFCPKRPTCPALHKLSHEIAVSDFNTLPITDVLTIEQIVKVLKYEDTIKDWMAKVRDHAKELMLQGQDIPGYKIVQSFGHAKWLDDNLVLAEFGDEFGDKLFEKKLISPAKFEKLAGKKRLGDNFRDEYTVRPESGYKIVEEGEKGEPVKTIKPQEDFNE